MTKQDTSSFIEVLHARGPAPDRADKLGTIQDVAWRGAAGRQDVVIAGGGLGTACSLSDPATLHRMAVWRRLREIAVDGLLARGTPC